MSLKDKTIVVTGGSRGLESSVRLCLIVVTVAAQQHSKRWAGR
jgi:hypothetical protein